MAYSYESHFMSPPYPISFPLPPSGLGPLSPGLVSLLPCHPSHAWHRRATRQRILRALKHDTFALPVEGHWALDYWPIFHAFVCLFVHFCFCFLPECIEIFTRSRRCYVILCTVCSWHKKSAVTRCKSLPEHKGRNEKQHDTHFARHTGLTFSWAGIEGKPLTS